MSQFSAIFDRGLSRGGDWFEDAARRRAAIEQFEREQQVRQQAIAEQAAYHDAINQRAQQEFEAEQAKARYAEIQRAAAAGFTKTITGQDVDPNVPLSMQGQAIGAAIAGAKVSALDAAKEATRQKTIARLSRQIPAKIEKIRTMHPNDPMRGPLITSLSKDMDEAYVLDMEPPDFAGFAAKSGNVLNLETAKKRVRDAELEIAASPPDKEVSDPARVAALRRQKLDDARRQHILGLTGQDPGSFYEADGAYRAYPQKAEERARKKYEAMVYAAENGQATPAAAGVMATPPPPAALIEPDQASDLTPAEEAHLAALIGEGMDGDEAYQQIIQSRGTQP